MPNPFNYLAPLIPPAAYLLLRRQFNDLYHAEPRPTLDQMREYLEGVDYEHLEEFEIGEDLELAEEALVDLLLYVPEGFVDVPLTPPPYFV